ncbi:MAG: hypothetical protein JWM42_2083 [Burkholderia sp.]|nr:hypothetical protein [Burkholderia sp.]
MITMTKHIAPTAASKHLEGFTTADTAMDMMGERSGRFLRKEGNGWNQILPKMRVPFVPPKPNEFFTAMLIGISRALLAQ